jgi:hypothetical protein
MKKQGKESRPKRNKKNQKKRNKIISQNNKILKELKNKEKDL